MEKSPIFGTLLREHRKAKGLSLWKFSVAIPYRQANIQRIERGLVEPRVRLAMRLLTVLEVDVGAFMDEMAVKENLLPSKSTQRDSLVPVLNITLEKGLKPLGMLLCETRMRNAKNLRMLSARQLGIPPAISLSLRMAGKSPKYPPC